MAHVAGGGKRGATRAPVPSRGNATKCRRGNARTSKPTSWRMRSAGWGTGGLTRNTAPSSGMRRTPYSARKTSTACSRKTTTFGTWEETTTHDDVLPYLQAAGGYTLHALPPARVQAASVHRANVGRSRDRTV